MNSPKMKFRLAGLKRILISRPKDADSRKHSGPTKALFGALPETPAGEQGQDLVDFLRRVSLFADLTRGDLKRLARIVHERAYRDGEIIYEQGTPGAALYLLRAGTVEILRRKQSGEEVPLATLEPPASFEELAAVGAEVVHWATARARGPIFLVAVGHSDLETLSRNFPPLANKILIKLAQLMAMRFEMLLETEYFNEESDGDLSQ
ncbi:MAG TPA: cyclic nucleotide-binding domain-containing protein [Syntrophales bacterium]|nr:cyclic nucleotide-binding domain-containing protein [Syntrophales bacterium]